jgi:hypothetical protein
MEMDPSSSGSEEVWVQSFWPPFVVSLIITPFALFSGFESAAAGHGNYFMAKLLFPFTMLSTVILETITVPFILVAFLQFPIYGAVLGWMNRRSDMKYALLSLLILHLGAAACCLFFVGDNFS